MRRDPGIEHVGGLQAVAGETKIEADLPGTARQEKRPADIGEEADAGLRHGEERMLAHHPIAPMHRQSHAAAHGDTVDQSEIGLSVVADERVQPVFVMPEAVSVVLAGLSRLRKAADIAAGAEGPLARPAHHHRGDAVVCRPGAEPGLQGMAHLQGQGVQRLRPVEQDPAEAALRGEKNFGVHAGIEADRKAAAQAIDGARRPISISSSVTIGPKLWMMPAESNKQE